LVGVLVAGQTSAVSRWSSVGEASRSSFVVTEPVSGAAPRAQDGMALDTSDDLRLARPLSSRHRG
jgi:hypothetical protein